MKPRKANQWNRNPKDWWCLTNLNKYPYEKWIYFKDIPGTIFDIIWNKIESKQTLIINDDFTAFKKVKWINPKVISI